MDKLVSNCTVNKKGLATSAGKTRAMRHYRLKDPECMTLDTKMRMIKYLERKIQSIHIFIKYLRENK